MASSRTRVSRAAKWGASAGFSPSITRASSKRSQMTSSNLFLVRRANVRGQGANQRMTGIDFEHRLRCRAEPAARGQHPFEPPVRPAIGCDKAGGTCRTALGRADVLDGIAQDLLHKGVERRKTGRRRLGPGRVLFRLLLKRNRFNIGRALGHRFERLAVKANRRRHPKGIYRDPAEAKPRSLWPGTLQSADWLTAAPNPRPEDNRSPSGSVCRSAR